MNVKYIVLICILSLTVVLFSCNNAFEENFWRFVAEELDDEEQKRQEQIENGEIVRGKDTVLIWGSIFEIGHYYDGNDLNLQTPEVSGTILKKISIHRIINDKLYVISDEGYAVIDSDEVCRVYITVSEEDFTKGYSIDEKGEKTYYSRYVEDEHIDYLKSFDEFSSKDQEVFAGLLR